MRVEASFFLAAHLSRPTAETDKRVYGFRRDRTGGRHRRRIVGAASAGPRAARRARRPARPRGGNQFRQCRVDRALVGRAVWLSAPYRYAAALCAQPVDRSLLGLQGHPVVCIVARALLVAFVAATARRRRAGHAAADPAKRD